MTQLAQSKNGGDVKKDPSSSRLKSATSVKSARRSIAMKFAGRFKRGTATESKQEQEVMAVNRIKTVCKPVIWDEQLESLQLRRKRTSAIFREVNFIRTRVIPPTPTFIDVQVKMHLVPGQQKRLQTYQVLKPCFQSSAELWQQEFKGPRYDKNGRIISHSILGDVETFLQYANINQDSIQVPEKTREISQLEKPLPTPAVNMCATKPLLKEELALQNWTNQMKMRRRNQRFLAAKLKCSEDQLLMRRSDQYIQKRVFIDQLDRIMKRNDPDICFWRQEEWIGAKQIAPTLTRTERGHPPWSPVMSGDADSFIAEKVKSSKLEPCKLAESEYCKAVLDQLGGKITIANQALFSQLELLGQPIKLNENQDHSKGGNLVSEEHLKGDNSEMVKGDNFNEVDYLLPGCCDVNEMPQEKKPVTLKNSRKKLLDRPATKRSTKSIKGPALCIGGTILTYNGNRGNKSDASLKDKIGFERSVFFSDPHTNLKSFQHSNNRMYTIDGPIVVQKKIAGSCSNQNSSAIWLPSNPNPSPSWFPSNRNACSSRNQISLELGSKENVNGHLSQCSQGQGDMVAKETIIMMKGKVGKVIKAHAVIENVGTTAVKFYWLKAQQRVNFNVPRQQRRPFYFHDDDGVILPNDKIFVPMLFRSMEPGIFTEAWLLKTIPKLEHGANIKFVFKVIVTHKKSSHEDILHVQNYIAKQQMETLCQMETEKIIDDAILKASLPAPLRDDPHFMSHKEIFELNNPRMHYHPSSMSTLQRIYEIAMANSQSRETTDDSSYPREKTHNFNPVWSVVEIRKRLLRMSIEASGTPVVTEVIKSATPVQTSTPNNDESVKSVLTEEDKYFRRKEDLLRALYQEIAVLSFRPFRRIVSKTQMLIQSVSMVLQSAVDTMVVHATILADTLELNPKETVDAKVETDKNKNSKTKSRAKDKKGGKGTSPIDKNPVTFLDNIGGTKEETYIFSSAHKMRTSSDKNKDEAVLAKYDQKVYCATYWIMKQTIEDIFDILQAV